MESTTCFEPDALAYRGARLDGDATQAPAPVIVVEVLSPSTGRDDATQTRVGSFRVPSVMRGVIVDPARRMVIHHRRGTEAMIETRRASTGDVVRAPPGFILSIADLFAEA